MHGMQAHLEAVGRSAPSSLRADLRRLDAAEAMWATADRDAALAEQDAQMVQARHDLHAAQASLAETSVALIRRHRRAHGEQVSCLKRSVAAHELLADAADAELGYARASMAAHVQHEQAAAAVAKAAGDVVVATKTSHRAQQVRWRMGARTGVPACVCARVRAGGEAGWACGRGKGFTAMAGAWAAPPCP